MEEAAPPPPVDSAGKAVAGAPVKALKLDEINIEDTIRHQTGLTEFDRVLGGGVVPGSMVLIGGEPGVGKSTLLLEISGALSEKGSKILYYSGEESGSQIKMRAGRLKINSNSLHLLSMGTLEDLKQAVEETQPEYLIIDSIQTLNSTRGTQTSGSASTLRNVTTEITELCKSNNITVFIIGHITKDGSIAGPKTLEHMVDVVLYFQGEMRSDLRILRAEKNRFGSVNELGIFQMSSSGLQSVKDPSQIFIQHREANESGISILPVMQGMRAILLEIQALVTESPFTGNPRRICVGFDNHRMSMLISVIEKKLKLPFYKSDVFLNITGGFSIKETSGDMAVTAALLSSMKNFSVPQDTIMIGEVGLTGEIRPVSYVENRVNEAIRQGFKNFLLPTSQVDFFNNKSIRTVGVKNIFDLYSSLR